MRHTQYFRWFVFLSAVLAAAGFWIGPGRWLAYAGSGDVPDLALLRLCTCFALSWFAVFIVSILRYRWRALWQLLFAPFALLWPGMFLIHGMSVLELFHV